MSKRLAKNQTVSAGELLLPEAQQLIQELQDRQQELENSERKYRTLYEYSPVGLLVLDAEANILEANLTFAQMLGIECSKLIGCSLSAFVDPLGQDTYRFFFHLLHSSGLPQQCEINLIQSNQNPLVAKLNGRVLSQKGKTSSYYIAASNVTAEKQADRRTHELAGERQRVKILANFIYGTSHDLRTPLTKIATGLYLIGKTSDKKQRLKKIDEINEAVFSLTHILEQLQAMAVLDSLVELELQPEAIYRVLTDVIKAVKAKADAKQINLISNFEDDLPKIPLDTDMLYLAVLNLIKNAIQFTPPGGFISLTAQRQDQHIAIEVADNGIGISANSLPHIFEHFFKADAVRAISTGGAGLGLPLAQRVVALHHGRLEVSSIPGVKTVFQISLPLNQP